MNRYENQNSKTELLCDNIIQRVLHASLNSKYKVMTRHHQKNKMKSKCTIQLQIQHKNGFISFSQIINFHKLVTPSL